MFQGYYESGMDLTIGYCDVHPSSARLEARNGAGSPWRVITDRELSSVSNGGVL